MNIKLALQRSYERLKRTGTKTPHLDAEVLLSTTINKPREFIFTYPEFKLTSKQYLFFTI